MKILSLFGTAAPAHFTDTFTVAAGGTTVTRTLGTSNRNGTYTATVRIAFSTSTTVSSATFNNCKITIGGVDTNLWGHQTSSTSGSVSYVDFEITGAISNGDSVAISIYNPSSTITRTVTVDVIIA